MAFPDGVQSVTLTAGAAGYRSLDGDAYQGMIRLTPSVPFWLSPHPFREPDWPPDDEPE